MTTTSGMRVYISQKGAAWVQLKGYAGGLILGMATGLEALDNDDDGVARYLKGNSTGSASQIAFRRIEGDAGQALALALGHIDHDGLGAVKVERPQGGAIVAEGFFHGAMHNPFDPDTYQGYLVSFTQTENDTEI